MIADTVKSPVHFSIRVVDFIKFIPRLHIFRLFQGGKFIDVRKAIINDKYPCIRI